MRIDRQKFFALTAALSAGCAAAPPPAIDLPPPVAPVAPPATATAPPPRPAPPPPLPAAPPKPEPAVECADDDDGSVGICSQLTIAPTCERAESFKMDCQQLTQTYRPAIAEKIATCIVKNAASRKRCPRYSDDAECIRNAVKTACVRSSVREQCIEMMAACTKRRQRITYTLDRCAQLLSASAPGADQNYTFTMAGLQSDGTPWAEGCWLD